MKRLLWLIQAFICLVPVLLLGALPRTLSIKTGEFLGLCMPFIFHGKKKIALKNIGIAQKGGFVPQDTPEKTVQKHFINLGRSLSELSMICLGREAVFRDIEFEGIEHYTAAKAKGRGVINITGHCGNWELLALAKSWKSHTTSSVARQLNNPYLNRWAEKLRTKFGNRIIYKSGALRDILSVLKSGESVGILMDQSVIKDEAVVTDFFGEKVYTMKTPALFAMKTGAAVVPLFINYLGNGKHRVRFEKEIPLRITGDREGDLVFNTQVFLEHIKRYIMENPTEWLWIHRRWKLSHGRKY